MPGLGLSWDETVYASQVSLHVPAAYFDPARARGISLLTAPAAAFTTSATTLHAYLAVASGLALLARCWCGAGWVLALAGLALTGLWVTQYYGPQAMPDLWVRCPAWPRSASSCAPPAVGRPGPGRAAAGSAAAASAAARYGGCTWRARGRAASDFTSGSGMSCGPASGPTLCRPCVAGYRYPVLIL